ncbi:MAG: hypothetical protein ACXWP1_09005, partial [Bdellovibrionota bacterium]
MSNGLKNWGERIRSLFSGAFGKLRARPAGFVPVPGQMSTLASGRLRMPLIDWEKLYRKSFVYNSVAAVICGYFVADLLVASLTPWFPPIQPPRPRNL